MTSHELIIEIERLQAELEKLGISSFLTTANLGELADEIKAFRCPHDDLEWIPEQLQDSWDQLEIDTITGLDSLGDYLSD